MWFILVALILLTQSGRNDFRNTFKGTGLGKLKLMRYSSKRASGACPYVMPFMIAIGFIIGYLSNTSVSNGFIGAFIALTFLALIPVLMPTPSMQVEKFFND